MITQLPKWVEAGAFILALVAGCVNAVGLLSFEHQAISHVSGTATLLGTSLTQFQAQPVLHLIGVLLSFLIGATITGALVKEPSLKLGRHYHTALIIESALLFLSLALLDHDIFYGHFLASAACGLQNALATTYSGAIIRTTHVTGIFTDLGLMIGAFLRGDKLDTRKAKLFLIIIFGFIAGGTLGAWLFAHWQETALAVPATICLCLAFSYRIYARHQRKKF